MNLQTLQINDIEQLFFSNGRTSQKTSHEFTLRSHPTHIPMEGTPDVSPTAYEGIPFFVKILGKFGGIFPQFFFPSPSDMVRWKFQATFDHEDARRPRRCPPRKTWHKPRCPTCCACCTLAFLGVATFQVPKMPRCWFLFGDLNLMVQ